MFKQGRMYKHRSMLDVGFRVINIKSNGVGCVNMEVYWYNFRYEYYIEWFDFITIIQGQQENYREIDLNQNPHYGRIGNITW